MLAMQCSRVCVIVFIGLILATAGFCLTLEGWFAPPLNNSVKSVRLAGPCLLFIGLLVLSLACLVCAISQNRCCLGCVHFYCEKKKEIQNAHINIPRTVNANHKNVNSVDQCDPLILDEMQQALESCHMVQQNRYIPSHVHSQAPSPGRVRHKAEKYIGVPTTGSPIHHHVNTLDQSASSGSFMVGAQTYHDSIDMTDSTETPSTSPAHQMTMYEGMGVRVKQYKRNNPHRNIDEYETRHLLDHGANVSHSPTPSPYSSPHWGPKHIQPPTTAQLNKSDDELGESPAASPSSNRKYSEPANIVLPRPGSHLEMELKPGHINKTNCSKKTEGPVWTPRAARWGSSPLVKDAGDIPTPPSYKDALIIHSDV